MMDLGSRPGVLAILVGHIKLAVITLQSLVQVQPPNMTVLIPDQNLEDTTLRVDPD